jgi:hypothetical protein
VVLPTTRPPRQLVGAVEGDDERRFEAQRARGQPASKAGPCSLRPPRSCGVAEVVRCGSSGDGRESPAQLLELALLRLDLGPALSVPPELLQLERQYYLKPPKRPVELRLLPHRLGQAMDCHCSVAMLKA